MRARTASLRGFFVRAQGDSPAKLAAIYLILIAWTVVTVYPILNVVSISLRPSDRLYSSSLRVIPKDATLAAYANVLTKKPYLVWMRNSLFVALSTSLVGVALAAPAAYAFSRFRFRGHRGGMTFFMLAQMFPLPMLLLPIYLLLARVGLADTLQGLTICYTATALPFCIWMLKGYFDTIPVVLEESAAVDGASPQTAFLRIVLPLSTPALAITVLFAFMNAWSEYMIARVVLTQSRLLTLPVGLVNMQFQFTTEWGNYSAAAIMTAIPAMVLFVSLARYLVSGLTLGGVKG